MSSSLLCIHKILMLPLSKLQKIRGGSFRNSRRCYIFSKTAEDADVIPNANPSPLKLGSTKDKVFDRDNQSFKMLPMEDPANATPEEMIAWANRSIQLDDFNTVDGVKYADASGKTVNHDQRCAALHNQLVLSVKENKFAYGPLADFVKDKDGSNFYVYVRRLLFCFSAPFI